MNKKKKTKLNRILSVVLSVLLFLVIAVFGVGYMYFKSIMTSDEDKTYFQNILDHSVGQVMDLLDTKTEKNRVTALLIGVDEDETRTDVMILATINKKTSEIDMISIPRDTQITVGQTLVTELKKMGSHIPSDGVIKLNELHAYALKSKPVDTLKGYIEGMFGIKIDYYVSVNLVAFKKIVNSVGGISFYVPEDMFYDDPTQSLLIDLSQGMQLLDGKKAEQLVRYRGYDGADFKRMQVQQDFLKEAFKQVIYNISIDKLPSVLLTLYQYVQTDFSISDLPEAVKLVKQVDMQNLKSHVIPAEGFKENEVWYVRLHDDELKVLLNDIFNPTNKKTLENKVINEREEALKWIEY